MDYVKIIEQNIETIIIGFIDMIPELALASIVLLVTYFATKIERFFLPRILQKAHVKKVLSEFIAAIFSFIIWIAGLLIAAGIIFPTITPGRILTALGLGSIAIGFAFKDIFENFMAGVLILLREPFKIGDIIEVDDVSGQVKSVTIRDTIIHDLDQEKIVIPNAMLFKNKVRVFTAFEKRRASVICGIAYGENIEKAKECICKALKKAKTVSQQDKIEVKAVEFNSSSVDLKILWFTGSSPYEMRESVDEVITLTKSALDTAGIEIPFPYRTLVFKNDLSMNKISTSS